jgi:hypothetical protein
MKSAMAYSEVIRIHHAATGQAMTSTGVKQQVIFKRPATILGFGVGTTSAQASPSAQPVWQLRHNSTVKATLTMVAANAAANKVTEISELQRGRNPVSPNGVMDQFDVSEGDVVDINLSTAESATTPANWILYILVAPKGSL